MPAAFGALSFDEPMAAEPDYPALWQRLNAPFIWRVRNERMLEAVREHRLAVMTAPSRPKDGGAGCLVQGPDPPDKVVEIR